MVLLANISCYLAFFHCFLILILIACSSSNSSTLIENDSGKCREYGGHMITKLPSLHLCSMDTVSVIKSWCAHTLSK